MIQCMVTGNKGVGKSLMLDKQFVPPWYWDYDKTILYDFEKDMTVDETEFHLHIYDGPDSNDDFSAMFDSTALQFKAFVLVYDITDRRSFDAVPDMIRRICRRHCYHHDEDYDGDISSSPPYLKFVLCGNKCDLSSERQVTREEGMAIAQKIGCPFFETSAKTGEGFEEALLALAHEVLILLSTGDNTNDANLPNRKKESKCIIC